ncbi:MAG: hypothetical protein ABIR81_01595 [Ginsengibacter sp.]
MSLQSIAQYKTFELSAKGDTLNALDNNNFKQGKWIISVPELRGEEGYEEEGVMKNDKKTGTWRKYSLNSDLLAIENYSYGGKDGQQQYFSKFGELLREENWRGYNPDAPYDTIPVYGTGNNEIISYKIVKAEQYSVKHGDWTYYDPGTGRIVKTETYDRNRLQQEPAKEVAATDDTKKKVKPQEVLDYEKKNSGKKKVKTRDGATSN